MDLIDEWPHGRTWISSNLEILPENGSRVALTMGKHGKYYGYSWILSTHFIMDIPSIRYNLPSFASLSLSVFVDNWMRSANLTTHLFVCSLLFVPYTDVFVNTCAQEHTNE